MKKGGTGGGRKGAKAKNLYCTQTGAQRVSGETLDGEGKTWQNQGKETITYKKSCLIFTCLKEGEMKWRQYISNCVTSNLGIYL